jgi:hypothetical protein
MTSRARDELTEFRARLDGGIGRAVQDSRLGDWPAADKQALARWDPGADFAILKDIGGKQWLQAPRVPAAIDRLEERFREDRELLLAVLFAPASALDRVREKAPGGTVAWWAGMCWVAEAARRVAGDAEPPSGHAVGDSEVLLPLAIRLRFLALSESMRWRGETGRAWWFAPAYQDFNGSRLVQRVNGDQLWHELVGQCQQARREWLSVLSAYQSNPHLVQATPRQFEAELDAVVFRHRRGAPLGLSPAQLTDAAPLTAEDKAIIAEVTNEHWLPRFNLRRVLSIAAHGDDGTLSVPRLAVGAGAVLLGLAAAGCVGFLHTQWAAFVSALCYLLVGGGILAFGPAWAAPWLLRMPAAAAVGIIALLSVLAGGWLGTPHVGLLASLVLIAVATGYLAVQLRQHGIERWALTRALAVAAIGTGHALMVSLIGLVYVAPAFALKEKSLASLWSSPGYWHTGLVLLLATAWCLAVGVFSQILWDDRPITAPLAHTSWRK